MDWVLSGSGDTSVIGYLGGGPTHQLNALMGEESVVTHHSRKQRCLVFWVCVQI